MTNCLGSMGSIAFKIISIERPGHALARSRDSRCIIPKPPPVGCEVQLVVLAIEAAVDPLAIVVVPAEHPIILPPLVPVIKVVA